VTVDFDHPASSPVNAVFTGWLERDGGRVELADLAWESAELVRATVPGGLALGRYDVHLVDPRGREAMLVQGLEIVDCRTTACPLPDAGSDTVSLFDAGWTACASFTFADLDLDTWGLPDSGAFLCGDYRAAVAGDCNDRDGLMHPDANEVCNRLDDDCDGLVDEGVCPDGGASWARVQQSGATWQTAWSWERGSLWMAGGSDVTIHRAGGGYPRVSMGCPSNLAASWAEASGRAYLGGGNPAIGRLGVHELATGGCEPPRQVSDPVTGIVGFARGDGGADVVAVLHNGRLVRGVSALDGAEVPSNLSASFRFEDLHGVAPRQLYAVGSDSSVSPGRMKVFRLGADGGWVDEHVERIPGVARGSLRAIWVLDAERVVAVGDNGTVLERTPHGWLRVAQVSDEADLTAVRAFDLGRAYVTDDEGVLRRWTGQRWERLDDTGDPLHDITGTAEDDLWCVGASGIVLHWPE
jgi:hypothetical protein